MANNNKTKLIIVVALIVFTIGYLEYSKNIGRINVPAGSADIPLSLNDIASSTDLVAAGQCSTGYCTTTASTSQKSVTVLNSSSVKPSSAALSASIADKLKKYPRAKELVSPDGFINTAPFKIADLIGKKVIIVDFWTYSCINCQRTLPYMNAWYAKYKDVGLEIIGVETPEFDFEKDKANVEAAVKKYGIKYPVVQDNERATWSAYENLYWPRKYIIDVDGFIAYDHIGEGSYEETEQNIQELLKEKAAREGKVLDFSGTVATEVAKTATVGMAGVSPETYFGANRNSDFVGNIQAGSAGEQTYTLPTSSDEYKMFKDTFYLGGRWNVAGEYVETGSVTTADKPASIKYKYTAMNVYLVAASKDGKPIDMDVYQDGVKVKTITVQGAALYPLIKNNSVESHTLELRIPKGGLQAYTFTFG